MVLLITDPSLDNGFHTAYSLQHMVATVTVPKGLDQESGTDGVGRRSEATDEWPREAR